MLHALLLVLLAASTAVSQASVSLRAAWLRDDQLELGRAAGRLGVRGLAAAISSGTRAETLAAIAAAPQADEAWALLEPLAARAGDDDRPIAAAAALAAVRIVRDLPPEEQLRRGAPVDELGDAAARFAAIAARAEIWPDVRVHAFECALGLADASTTLPPLLGDDDAEVRRAAVGFADAQAASVASRLGELAASDPDEAVAAAAAAALCRAHVALPDAARARARKLVERADANVDPGDVSSLRRCPPR